MVDFYFSLRAIRTARRGLACELLNCLLLTLLASTIVTMYAKNEILYGTFVLVFTATFGFVFLSEKAYVWRYVFPGLVGVFVFVIFPIMYTLGLTFTNKSNLHLLSFAQSKAYFLQQAYVAEGLLLVGCAGC